MSYSPKIVELIEKLNQESGLDTESNHQHLKNLQHGSQKVDFAYEYLKKSATFNSILKKTKIRKSNKASEEWKTKGFECVKLQKHVTALDYFTKSIACAENGSDHLAEALAARATLLSNKGYNSACLEDVDKALQIPCSRIRQCLTNLKEAAASNGCQKTPTEDFNPSALIKDKNSKCSSASSLIELKTDELVGRHFIAAKDIPLGETLVVEKSFVHTISPENRYLHCHECLKICYNLIPCPQCRSALYCSDSCEKQAESYHKYECDVGDLYGELTLNFIKMAAKALEELGNFREISNLVTNEERRNGPNLYYPIIMAAIGFQELKEKTAILSSFRIRENELKDLIYRCIMIDSINSFNIKKYSAGRAETIALGVFSFSSLFNHSCAPNCQYSFHGRNIVVRTLSKIKKGEECNISYCGNYAPLAAKTTKERQRHLEDVFFFKCHCRACLKIEKEDSN